jgi:hypothetical protein
MSEDIEKLGDVEASAAPSCSPVRVWRRRAKGWRMPENTVSVCRPGKWGNPFRVGDWRPDGEGFIRDTEEAVELFRAHEDAAAIRDAAPDLRGKNLACFCKLDQPCHADVLLHLANAKEQQPERSAPDA